MAKTNKQMSEELDKKLDALEYLKTKVIIYVGQLSKA